MIYPLGTVPIVDTPGEYHILRSGPIEASCSLFVGLGTRCVSLWSFSPICLLSHHEWRQQSEAGHGRAAIQNSTFNVVYKEIVKWAAAEWRTIDVLRSDGLIDRFCIVDTSVSIFPVISQAATSFPMGMHPPSLTTVPLGLRYEATVDPAGHSLTIIPNSLYVPISVSSRLYQTADGLLGQITSDGFFAFELRLPDGHYIDLKASKLFMSFKTHVEIDRRTSFSASNGLLAVCGPRHVRVYDLYQVGSPLITKINNSLSQTALEEVVWISEDEVALLASDVIILVNVHEGSQVPVGLPGQDMREGTAPSSSLYSHLIICPQRTCILSLDRCGRRMVRLALARPLDTCGRVSKLVAYILAGRQLHWLAIPSSPFSSDRRSSTVSLRDQTMVWKFLDVPLQSYLQGSVNGPIRVACQDSSGQWILLAGRTGFCIFNHLGNGSGSWMLFSDPQESETFVVKLATWIQPEVTEQQLPPVLSLYVWFEERRQHEFLLFVVADGRRFLSLHRAAHRQTAEGRVVALYDCSQGVLAILLEDAILQLVQLSVREVTTSSLRMSLILRASLDSVLTMGALKKVTKLTYIRDHALLLVKTDDGLLSVVMPLGPPESADHRYDINAKVLIKGRISDFLVWSTGSGWYWIMTQIGQQIHCREVPLVTERSFEFEGDLSSFYPSHAYGLYLKTELMGNGTVEHTYRLAVAGTETFVVPLLHYLISLEGDDEGSHFYQTAKSLDRRNIGVFLLIMEMLLERILARTPLPQQARLYRRLKYRLQDLVTGSEYRQVISRFLRRVEAEDARRIMGILGPFGELFERSLRGEELLAAWSFYRIATTGTAEEREDYRLLARSQNLLERALEGRRLAIMRGVLRLTRELQLDGLEPTITKISALSAEKRDWPVLEMLHSEGCLPLRQIKANPDDSVDGMLANSMLHSRHCRDGLLRSLEVMPNSSDKNHSHVTHFLRKLSLTVESALWSCIVDGRGYDESILAETISLDDLTSIIRNTYDTL